MPKTLLPRATEPASAGNDDTASPARKPLSPAAERALAEAEERRRLAKPPTRPVEVGGREGPEPVRYGDWERGGIAYDF